MNGGAQVLCPRAGAWKPAAHDMPGGAPAAARRRAAPAPGRCGPGGAARRARARVHARAVRDDLAGEASPERLSF